LFLFLQWHRHLKRLNNGKELKAIHEEYKTTRNDGISMGKIPTQQIKKNTQGQFCCGKNPMQKTATQAFAAEFRPQQNHMCICVGVRSVAKTTCHTVKMLHLCGTKVHRKCT